MTHSNPSEKNAYKKFIKAQKLRLNIVNIELGHQKKEYVPVNLPLIPN